ncbi:trypsin-like peptidase domain-containing protein [Candidatus Mycobacterium wuenschmannii]|uniref:Trypsin-like peptidase domain-containing protein n=1 Tax=Candidatus Mycobacterium wuenschmannii TaxID=3027808 RepID=A0ABY8VTS3_9MYCO|nr:trypsin-like peptidase domain-containing protein [Candidatus Mycobacterium wuenschmannii]WIM86897.1 trypsin-like peptidase domain-containing protein [Candidatus Mycobacterium wuenschmannii]
MSGSHRRTPRRSLSVLSLLAATGLAFATVPANAAPVMPPLPRDAASATSVVGPQIVDIDAKLGFQSAIGAGTGIVIDPSVILTNNHVVAGATDLTARSIANGQVFPATVIGFDRQHDIAVLQLAGGGLPVANIGNSDSVSVGEPVVSLGNAGGVGGAPSVEEGRVAALNQTVSANDALTGSTETLVGLIQIDANIRPGDSGGPTVNSANQVIGMNTAASQNFHLGRGQGFAIPINQAMAIAGQIRSGASSPTVHIGPTAFLGVGVNDAPGGGGAIVRQVIPSGPAAGAGLNPGDVINAINGQPVNSATALTNILDQHHPGDHVSVGLQGRAIDVTLGDGPPG